MNQKDRNGTGATLRRKFDETYKRHAVELTLHGDRTVKTVAKELGILGWALYEWRKLYAPRPGDSGPAPQTLEEAEKEISRLRGELLRMREREIVLKKIGRPTLRNVRERYAEIEAMKDAHSIRGLCQLWGVAPSGYYRRRHGQPSARQRADVALAVQITAAQAASRGTYGALRIVEDLREAGTRTSKRRCARLMRDQGLCGRKKHSRRPRTTDSRHAQPVAIQSPPLL